MPRRKYPIKQYARKLTLEVEAEARKQYFKWKLSREEVCANLNISKSSLGRIIGPENLT